MNSYVLSFQEIDKTKISVVGGKGVNLGEISKSQGIVVPEGFCVTTEAYKKITGNNQELNTLLDELSYLSIEDKEKVSEISKKVRKVIERIAISKDIEEEIENYLIKFGENDAYAVRSSATAEDLPTASFAGQQDTYLNIIGKKEILKHISKCWASLFTERAVIYRLQNDFDHRSVHLAVVVQKMVFPQAAGIMFTADPVNFNRKVLSIDASFGLGEALVSGLVNPDIYKVKSGKIIHKNIAAKKLAIYPLKTGGTKEQEISPKMQNSQVLTDEQILSLTAMGRKIEEYFGSPQDIEWCFADDTFYIVQSRPITTLFPIPEANDEENHVYVSVGHQQMMTDPMKPLGLSFFLLTTPAPMRKAGGRLFVDVTHMLVSPVSRKSVIDGLGESDPLIKDALMTIIEREDFMKLLPDDKTVQNNGNPNKNISSSEFEAKIENSMKTVPDSIKNSQMSLEELKQNIQTKSGLELLDFIIEDIPQLKKFLFDPRMSIIMDAMDAATWINEKMNKWLGEKNTADTLSQSVPNNITSEMGLELLDVADVIRPYPEIIDYLKHVKDDNFLDELIKFNGGQETKDAILSYLNKYGMRCVGEIDITKTRWSEKPITLLPMILSNIKNFAPNASHKKFEQGRQEALKKEKELLEKLNKLPNGEEKVKETKKRIDIIRNFIGYREYPKYGMVSRYFVYKQALLREAEKLVKKNIIHEKEDIYYLTFEELREVVGINKLDYNIINKRKEEYKL
jgi:rifampicin phosphotransferase